MSGTQQNSPSLWSLPKLGTEDHKYTRGHVLVYGGAVMTGASRLSALAALRIGAGLVTLAAPEKAWPIYAESLLSVITRPIISTHDWWKLLGDERINVVLIGPGAGVNEATTDAIRAAADSGKALLLDADALTLLAKDETLRKEIKNPLILAPHEGEYEKLAKALKLDTSKDKETRAADLAKTMSAVVILKGAETIIADGRRIVVNRNAPPTLATGGTGDVLAGMVAGLVAQGMTPFDGACAATYIHGEAANALGRGLIAEDLLEKIPSILQKL